ncbi:hypothetical protein DXG01_010666 [Tephrocybe rancida]|nr:hypothetical protein DXG01_010666 [Tephrocybe rancida]
MYPFTVPARVDTTPRVDVATEYAVDSNMLFNFRKELTQLDFDDTQNGAISLGDDINQEHSPVERSAAARLSPGTMGYSPPTAGWGGPYAGPAASPVFSPGHPPPQMYYSDFYPREIGNPPSNSNSTSSSMSDDAMFVTDDPNYSEHFHQYQSRVRIMDEQPLVHVPPFYHPPPAPPGPLSLDMTYLTQPAMYGAYGYAPVSPNALLKPKSRSRTDIRHKAVNYKSSTKLMELVRMGQDAHCQSSVICCDVLRIHGSPHESPTSPISERLLPVPPPATLPPKPVTAVEENKKKNFFPISWRVIGGGVLMGSESSKFSTEQGSSDLEYVAVHGTPSEDTESGTKAIPLSPIKRTRSSSIPPAPKTHHVDTGALFSAESPGNL